jgi:hypothetical protein
MTHGEVNVKMEAAGLSKMEVVAIVGGIMSQKHRNMHALI